jgi:hypothetical protein
VGLVSQECRIAAPIESKNIDRNGSWRHGACADGTVHYPDSLREAVDGIGAR